MISTTDMTYQTNINLLQGIITSIKNVVPLHLTNSSPQITEQSIFLDYGVSIKITGDIKGKLVMTGDISVFSAIGQSMSGMSLEGEMLDSFIGELGNMVAGSFSTIIVEYGMPTNITTPFVIKESTVLTEFDKGMQVPVSFGNTGDMDIYLLID
ncbi:chemotaxis protein CheX [Halalkalibacter flavus]|uniref:chemotaxis protein CheX n=1 Tax=Halalkalibacter flavus TaxID=3090668 RepID=UPI002FC83407